MVGLPRETGRNISPPEKVEEAWGNALAVFESPGRRDLIGGGVPNHRPALQERIAALDRGDAGSRRDDGDKDVTMRPPLVTIPIQPVPRLRWPVEGLLLDACNTLYDATLWQRWLLQVLRRLGLHTTYRCFFHVWKKDYLDAVHRGDREFCEAFREFLQAVGLNRGQILEVTIACQSRRQRWEQETRLLPGVRTTLNRLAGAGAALAVVGDCEHRGDALRRRLETMGLDGVLTAVVSSRYRQDKTGPVLLRNGPGGVEPAPARWPTSAAMPMTWRAPRGWACRRSPSTPHQASRRKSTSRGSRNSPIWWRHRSAAARRDEWEAISRQP